MLYFMALDNQREGPFTIQQMQQNGLRADTLVWCQGMPDWRPAGQLPELSILLNGTVGPPPPRFASPARPMNYAATMGYDRNDANGKKTAAGVCGILLGSLGIHKFILGFHTAGVIMLVLSVATCGLAAPIMHLIGLIEGIIYLTQSDEQFYLTYMVRKKDWF